MANAVPAIPPLSSISDPNTRAVIQAIVDGLNVRNGAVGDGNERFVTAGELAGVSASSSASNRSAINRGLTDSSGFLTPGATTTLIKRLSDSILQSRVWKYLDERITRIDMPEWFQGRFGAAIKTEEVIRENADSALASQITTAVSNINGNIALVQQQLTAESALAGATASAVTQLQNKVGSVDAAARQAMELASTIDGKVSGTWSVKFDVNGYVAGVALGVDKVSGYPPKSSFVVRADTFAVGSPGSQDVVPFFVQGGTSYLNKAMIGDAWIDNAKIADGAITSAKIGYAAITSAKIGDLEVGTLKIANGAITRMCSAYRPNTGVTQSTFSAYLQNMYTGRMTLDVWSSVVVYAQGAMQVSFPYCKLVLYRNETQVTDLPWAIYADGSAPTIGGSTNAAQIKPITIVETLPPGGYYYSIRWVPTLGTPTNTDTPFTGAIVAVAYQR